MPPQPVAFFTGRETELKAIENRLKLSGTVAITQAITGLGGVGKTQTALAFCDRRKEQYTYRIWIDADSSASLLLAFRRIAAMVGFPTWETVAEKLVVNVVHAWMRETEGWLVVFDNVDDFKTLRPYLPQAHRGHILLTTRSNYLDALDNCTSTPLDVLPLEDAVRFLLERCNRLDSDEKEQQAVRELALELGCLPLALEQAAAYCVQTYRTYQGYLKDYRIRRSRQLSQSLPMKGDYHATVSTTWTKNFQVVQKRSRYAAELLQWSAFLAPDLIPYDTHNTASDFSWMRPTELADALCATITRKQDAVVLPQELLAILNEYSLIRWNHDLHGYSVHRLVQQVVRDSLPWKTQRNYVERVLEVVRQVVSWVDHREFAEDTLFLDHLLPHLRACATHILEYTIETETASTVLMQTAHALKSRVEYQEALPLYRLAWEIRTRIFGLEHSHTVQSLNALGELYFLLRQYDEAFPLLEQALAIYEKTLGTEHPITLTTRQQIGLFREERDDIPSPLLLDIGSPKGL